MYIERKSKAISNEEGGVKRNLLKGVVQRSKMIPIGKSGAYEDKQFVTCGFNPLKTAPGPLWVLNNMLQGADTVDGIKRCLLATAQPIHLKHKACRRK